MGYPRFRSFDMRLSFVVRPHLLFLFFYTPLFIFLALCFVLIGGSSFLTIILLLGYFRR